MNAIDDKEHEFVRRHIKLPGHFNFGRSSNVPNLEMVPALHHLSLRRDDRALERTYSTTSWIMFARTLNAYSIKVPLGGTLEIFYSQAWLPVHRLWILTIGLLGRYGHRIDGGRARCAPTEARIDRRDVSYNNNYNNPNYLSGITGDFRYTPNAFPSDIEQGVGQLYFMARDKETRGSLRPDDVPLTLLFWMLFGCVPLSDGRVFDAYRHTERQSMNLRSTLEPGPENLAYRFQPMQGIIPGAGVILWAQSLLGNLPEVSRLQRYNPTTSEEQAAMLALLSTSEDTEDIPSPWIKSARFDVDEYFEGEVLLWHPDIQALSLGMLELKWSPRGCLFDAERGRFCRRILCQASSLLYALSKVALRISEASTPTDARKGGLMKPLETILPMCSWRLRSDFSRELHEALFAFEQGLLSKFARIIPFLAVGVIFIASKRFQKFVLSLAKHDRNRDLNCKVLTVDSNANHVLVHLSKEVPDLKFNLNFGEVFNARKELACATLTREEVLFAALGACVRSVAFQFSYDSKPLLDFVCRINAARTEVPLSGAGFAPPTDTDFRYRPDFFAMKVHSFDERRDHDRQAVAEDVDDNLVEDSNASRYGSDQSHGHESEDSKDDHLTDISSHSRVRGQDPKDGNDNHPIKRTHTSHSSNKHCAESECSDCSEERAFETSTRNGKLRIMELELENAIILNKRELMQEKKETTMATPGIHRTTSTERVSSRTRPQQDL